LDTQEDSTAQIPRAADVFEFPDGHARMVTWPEVQRLAESLAYIGDQVAAEQAWIHPSRRRRSKRRLLRTRRRKMSGREHPGHAGYGLEALLRRITAVPVPVPDSPVQAQRHRAMEAKTASARHR
jgi:hypothetical protein